ncbi:MDR family MFS transporter [Paenibacillus sp. GCM10027629]|uniref:MDR family MFS transporter n=1 Tax=Paenibacillus sp. GCM10027629 TaxID=3273414 RepID=UPI0036407C3C
MVKGKNNLGLVVTALLLGILMASMDNTIVSTAMGTIVSDLGGMDKFVWVTSAYMVAEMAGMPIFGKLSDMYGRKRFFIFGLIFFLAGSILCATAETITQLSIYRAIQGIGGGALVPIAFTIMFDIFPPEKRGKMGGLFGAVFGLSSIFGPLLGAFITDTFTWHWIFFINVPLGVVALLLVVLFYHESHEHSRQQIDWAGATTLVGSIICLMFALELGGGTYAWDSTVILSLFAGFTVLFIIFLFIERTAKEPIIAYSMFKNRLFASSTIIGLFSGAAFIAAAVYIPIFVQGVTGGTATNSGMILLPMMLGTTVSAQVGAMSSVKFGYRKVMVVFMLIFLIGIALLTTITTDTSRGMITFYMIITGLGLGASFSVLGMAAIHHFDASQRGSANSTIAFIRSLGMTIGITIFGMVQKNDFTNGLKSAFAGMGSAPQGMDMLSDPRAILSPEARGSIPPEILEKVTHALSSSIVQTFMWALIPTVLALLFTFYMTNDRMKSYQEQAAEAKAEAEARATTSSSS